MVGIPTPLKNDGVKVSWDDDYSQSDGKNKKCSKPPTSMPLGLAHWMISATIFWIWNTEKHWMISST